MRPIQGQPIELSPPGARPGVAALRGDHLAWADADGNVHTERVAGGGPRLLAALDARPLDIEVSDTGDHVRVRLDGRVVVIDRGTGAVVADLAARAPSTLMSDATGDLVLVVREAGLIEGLRLPDLGRVMEVDLRRCGYTVTSMSQLGTTGGGLLVVGHPWSEGFDWLLFFPWSHLGPDFTPFATDRDCYHSSYIVHEGIPIVGGDAGEGDVVVYRDHDGAEDPGDDEDPRWGLHGLYVCSVPFSSMQWQMPFAPTPPLGPDAQIFATATTVVVVDGTRMHLVPRDGSEATVVAGSLFAIDPPRARVLVVHVDGGTEVLAIP